MGPSQRLQSFRINPPDVFSPQTSVSFRKHPPTLGCPSHRLQGIICSCAWGISSPSSSFTLLSVGFFLSHFFLTPLTAAWHILPFLTYTFSEDISLAEGLSCPRQWVCWSQLEAAVSGTGQPQPPVTEVTLQPPLPQPGNLHQIPTICVAF